MELRRLSKGEAERLFKAARAAGYERTSIIKHPDGRIEIAAEVMRNADRAGEPGEWDDVLQS